MPTQVTRAFRAFSSKVTLFFGLSLAVMPALQAGSDTGSPRVMLGVPKKLSLDQAVQIAIQQNPSILNAEQEIERNVGLVIEVRAQALPQLGVTSSYNQQDQRLVYGPVIPGTPLPNPAGTFTAGQAAVIRAIEQSVSAPTQITAGQEKSWNVSFEVRQLIYSGGQVGAAIQASRYTRDAALYQLRDTVDSTINSVRQSFYQVLLDRALINVQNENLAQAKADLKDQQDRFEAGTVPKYNVLRAEVEVANVLPQLIQAKNDYKIAQLQLAKLLGLNYSGARAEEDTIDALGDLTVDPNDLTLNEALTWAKANRASLKSQRENILTYVANIKVQLAGYQPTISANAGYKFENSPFTSHFDQEVHGWFFGVTGSWNLFDGGATYGRVKQAKAQLEEARISYFDAVRQVELDVQDAYSSLQEAKQLIESQKKNVETAEEALRLAQERFRAGAGTQLDVLDARVALVQAETNELQARYNYNVALANLDRATAVNTRYDDTFNDPLSRLHVKDPVVPQKYLDEPKSPAKYIQTSVASPVPTKSSTSHNSSGK
ncbi:MAG: TolC family protein [Chthoniobacteraceae bacterium]